MQQSEKKWWILIAMCLLTAILNIDVSGINIAIPVIAHEFYANLANMQWVINAYVLMSAALQILGGRLGDTYGHRKIFLIGTALFILSSLGAGISINEQMLIAFRFFQGIALGLAFPMTVVLIMAAFPKNKQGFALSFTVTTMGIFLAIGPPLGGLFVRYLTWRWIFFINIPIGIFTFILAYIFCKPHKAKEKKYIDYKGAVFLILGLISLTLALNQLQNWGLSSFLFWITFLLGIGLFIVLFFICRKQNYPIFEFPLFKIRNFTIHHIVRMIAQLIFIPILFFIPIYLQNIAGVSPVYSGLAMLFLTVVIAVLSPFTGKWIDQIGEKIPNILSTALFAIACFLLTFLKSQPNLYILAIALAFVGFATAVTFVSTITGVLLACSEEKHGIASGMIFTTAWLGCAFGIALMGSILVPNSDRYLDAKLDKSAFTLTKQQTKDVERVSRGVLPYQHLKQYFSEKEATILGKIARDSFMYGFRISMYVFMALALFGMIVSFFLVPHKLDHKVHPPPTM